jgi:pimeloyl-ACP methyl ester carboxylesterase
MGEEDYLFLPTITALVKDHKNAQLQVIPACGHVVNVDKPHQFNQITISFITKIEKLTN